MEITEYQTLSKLSRHISQNHSEKANHLVDNIETVPNIVFQIFTNLFIDFSCQRNNLQNPFMQWHLPFGAAWRQSHLHPPFPAAATNIKSKKLSSNNGIHTHAHNVSGGDTSSGVCSALRRRPSNKNAIELISTDCRSQ